MKPLQAQMLVLLRASGASPKQLYSALWLMSVDQPLSDYTRVSGVRGDTLIVEVASAQFAQEVSLRRGHFFSLLRRVGGGLSLPLLREVSTRVSAEGFPPLMQPEVARPKPPPRPPSPEELQASKVEEVEDPELREVLFRLWRKRVKR